MKNLIKTIFFIILPLIISYSLIWVLSWIGPTQAPPGGSGAISVDSSGNVGIGTTNPGARLGVKGSTSDSTAASLNIQNLLGNTLLYVRNDGNVGVGTSAPSQKLSVAGTVESTSGGFKFPDGTTQTTAGINSNFINSQTFLSNGTFTVPVSVNQIFITGCAGGSGGADGRNGIGSGGGGSGQAVYKYRVQVTPNENIAVTIGAGGSGNTGTASGGDGGNTFFGSYITLFGALGGCSDSCIGQDASRGGPGGGGDANNIRPRPPQNEDGYNASTMGYYIFGASGGSGGVVNSNNGIGGVGGSHVYSGGNRHSSNNGYGGGGGGGGLFGVGATGGQGISTNSAASAAANSCAGGGGGGGNGAGSGGPGGSGGSGKLIAEW